MENIRVNAFNIKNAYPWTCLYEHDDYQAFIENPLNKKCQDRVKSEVLKFNYIPKHYNMLIGDAEKEMLHNDQKSRKPLPKLSPPFLPSFPSMARDVEKTSTKNQS